MDARITLENIKDILITAAVFTVSVRLGRYSRSLWKLELLICVPILFIKNVLTFV